MEEGTEITAVSIHGRSYRVRSGDPDRVRRLAGFLDRRMNEVSRRTPTVDSLKVAVLAGLDIVDRYLAAQDELDALAEEVSDRSRRMAEQLEAALGRPL